MNTWRFIPLKVNNGFFNMALDEAVLQNAIEKGSSNTLRFYKWKPSTASIGSNQSLSSEINRAFARENKIDIVRRVTGGGAVFHDENREITYSIICSKKSLENLGAKKVIEQFECITQAIIKGLSIFGLEMEKGLIHCPSISLNGKKFSGNAQFRKKGYILQHGTILLELEPDLMYSILKAPENITKSRMVRSVRAKCIGIKNYIKNYNEKNLVNSLKRGFEISLGIEFKEGPFSATEIKLAERLVKEKYNNMDWLKKYE